ncbi:MAG: PHP domain-containing protein [Ignavibacteriales bacterium]
MAYDLHVHTTASDGMLSPIQVIQDAMLLGLDGIAITDHDTVSGIEPALEYVKDNNCPMHVIPGIELNTDAGPIEVHILGYFLKWSNPKLLSKLAEIKSARLERAVKMVKRLNDMGIEITLLRVKELAKGDLLGRPHVAQAMVEKGYCFSIKETFDKYIGQGRPAYVPRYKFLPQEAIDIIKDSQGIAVLAHPGLIKNNDLIARLVNMGIDGIEAYYPEHSEIQTEYFVNMAEERGLIVTGGSDFHGSIYDTKSKLGCVQIDRLLFNKMRMYHERKTS